MTKYLRIIITWLQQIILLIYFHFWWKENVKISVEQESNKYTATDWGLFVYTVMCFMAFWSWFALPDFGREEMEAKKILFVLSPQPKTTSSFLNSVSVNLKTLGL